jgi:hypothetical protein
MKRKVVNFALFYAGWFATVQLRDWRSLVAVAVAVGVHLAISRSRAEDARTIGWAVLIGTAADTLLERTGLLRYEGGPRLLFFCPLWIAGLWAMFATTLNSSLGWLKGRPVAGALLGAIGGPLSYYTAARFGAVDIGTPGLVAVGVEYAILVPILLMVAHGVTVPTRSPA